MVYEEPYIRYIFSLILSVWSRCQMCGLWLIKTLKYENKRIHLNSTNVFIVFIFCADSLSLLISGSFDSLYDVTHKFPSRSLLILHSFSAARCWPLCGVHHIDGWMFSLLGRRCRRRCCFGIFTTGGRVSVSSYGFVGRVERDELDRFEDLNFWMWVSEWEKIYVCFYSTRHLSYRG